MKGFKKQDKKKDQSFIDLLNETDEALADIDKYLEELHLRQERIRVFYEETMLLGRKFDNVYVNQTDVIKKELQ